MPEVAQMFNVKINKRYKFAYIKNFMLGIFILLFSSVMIISPSLHRTGIMQGIGFCTDILIPSLFPFMVLASFVVKSGFAEKLSSLLSPVTKFLFYLPGCTGATIILSLVGGYPTGAKGIKDLLDKKLITAKQANRMSLFAVGAGPAFIISVVGEVLFKSNFIGVVLFTVQVVSALITGIICGVIARAQNINFYDPMKEKSEQAKISDAVVESCADATNSMLNMCAFVVLFSAVISMIKKFRILDVLSNHLIALGVPNAVSVSILPVILEVTAGCIDAVSCGAGPVLIAFAVSWGGVCVHLQIASILKNTGFSYFKFCVFRFSSGMIASVLTFIVISFLRVSMPVFSTFEQKPVVGISSNTVGSIALILLCLYFTVSVFSFSRKKKALPEKFPVKAFN